MPTRRQAPENWDDHAAWEDRYAGAPDLARERADDPLPFGVSAAERFAGFVADRGFRKLWFPGCGLDGCPRVYASLGYDVWATDISRSAVAVQRQMAERPYDGLRDEDISRLRYYLPNLKSWSPGALHADVHDFREPFPWGECDCILNIRSFQGLPSDSLNKASRTFYTALREGGHALFDTQNVQGDSRDVLEDALLAVGFTLPGIETQRWYRHAIRDAGIIANFVMGRPVLSRKGARYRGRGADAAAKADEELLIDISAQYQRRVEASSEEQQRIWNDTTTRIAHIVYNTG